MSPIFRRISTWSVAVALGACSSEQSETSKPLACSPGQSIACAGISACSGFQICNQEGSGYGDCRCTTTPVNQTRQSADGSSGAAVAIGSAPSNAAPIFNGYGGLVGLGGAQATQPRTSAAAGSENQTTNSVSPACSPADMSSFVDPAYKPARVRTAACAEAELEGYFDECYSSGNCTKYRSGGASERCGSCLLPVRIDADHYGPVIRLGSDASPLDITNTAGCLELEGELDCASPTQAAALCEYYACVERCPTTGASGYQSLMDCMSAARDTSCARARGEAVCIRDPAHVAACSGTGFRGQFLAIARVFCTQGK